MKDAIVVDRVSKEFRQYSPDRPWTLQEAMLRGLRRTKPVDRFWALRDVSFSVSPGRTLGVIGANGSGKSTLLRLLGGVPLLVHAVRNLAAARLVDLVVVAAPPDQVTAVRALLADHHTGAAATGVVVRRADDLGAPDDLEGIVEPFAARQFGRQGR